MPITRTYSVGDGCVRRLDNLTGPWLDVSPGVPGGLYDVETDPLDGDKVFVVGDGSVASGAFGIHVSTDAGTTWQIPGGNYQTNIDAGNTIHWFEVWVLDSNNIFAAGENGYIAISTDGGLTFNLSTQLPPLPGCPACIPTIQTVNTLHFINPLIGVVGTAQNVVGTVDGGVTWVVLNGGGILVPTTGDVIAVVGIHMSADQQTIVACGVGRMMQSLDAGNTFNEVYNWNGNGLHLTWINDLELWGFGRNNEIIKTLDGGATWLIVAPVLGGGPLHRAGHFYLGQNGFFSSDAVMNSTPDGATSGIFSENGPCSLAAVWTWYYNPICYRLIDCKGILAPIIVTTDLSAILGQVVQVCLNPCFPQADCCAPVDACWIVELSPTCQGALVPGQIEITNTYQTCVDCEPVCYLLRDCEGLKPDIVTGNDLALYLGQVIQLEGCGTTCWQVLLSPNCDNCIPLSAITLTFVDCTACLPPPPPPPPLELNPRRIKPGYTTPGCPPEYTEKVSCAFMDVMFDDMLAKRYGITSCCDDDMQKWVIKKQLLNLRALYDPSLCKSSLVDCCPPCRIEATIEVFNPAQCAPPTNLIATLDLIPGICDPPTGLQTPVILVG